MKRAVCWCLCPHNLPGCLLLGAGTCPKANEHGVRMGGNNLFYDGLFNLNINVMMDVIKNLHKYIKQMSYFAHKIPYPLAFITLLIFFVSGFLDFATPGLYRVRLQYHSNS